MAVEDSSTDVESRLAWEAKQRAPAALAAALAALLTFAGAVWGSVLFTDVPRSGLVEALDLAAQPGAVGEQESLRAATYAFYDENKASVLLSSVVRALGLLALGWAITYLAVAVRGRRPEFPKLALYLPAIGAVLSAVATMLSTVATMLSVSDFLAGARTLDDADAINSSGLLLTAQFINLPGLLALALALVLVSLNAMKVGLLTKFVGVLGVITGGLLIFPIGSPLPIVQCFWLVLLSILFLQRWPAGQPPAWRTGRAEPWPSGAEIRKQRQAAAAARRGEAPPPEPVAAGSARRKRKRRT